MSKVVVLGAGYAGMACVAGLKGAKGLDVTVVDTRANSIGKMAGARAATLGDTFAHRILVPNDSVHKTKTVNKKVVSIDPAEKKLTFGDDSAISYDILVCATGASNISPCEAPMELTSTKEQAQYYEGVAEKIKAAKNITILGSGAVGTELAGEIIYAYPDKEVSIVSRSAVLCSGVVPDPKKKFHTNLQKIAEKRGVKLLLSTTTDSVKMEDFDEHRCIVGPKELVLSNGEKHTTDLVMRCTGTTLNNQVYPADWLNEEGRLKVDGNLLVNGLPDVFAIGDITDLNESKLGYLAGMHGGVAAKNVIAVAKGKKPTKTYKASSSVGILVPFGRKAGAGQFGGILLGSFSISMVKGKHAFAPLLWGSAGKSKQILKEGDKDWKTKRGI